MSRKAPNSRAFIQSNFGRKPEVSCFEVQFRKSESRCWVLRQVVHQSKDIKIYHKYHNACKDYSRKRKALKADSALESNHKQSDRAVHYFPDDNVLHECQFQKQARKNNHTAHYPPYKHQNHDICNKFYIDNTRKSPNFLTKKYKFCAVLSGAVIYASV